MSRIPCLMCHRLHEFGECSLLTEPLSVMLPEWLDKQLRERVPPGERSRSCVVYSRRR